MGDDLSMHMSYGGHGHGRSIDGMRGRRGYNPHARHYETGGHRHGRHSRHIAFSDDDDEEDFSSDEYDDYNGDDEMMYAPVHVKPAQL